MKYIITGGLGFIGSHLYPKLKKNNKKVLLIDNLYSGITDNIKDLNDGDFINMDIRNVEIEKYFNENMVDSASAFASAQILINFISMLPKYMIE